MAVVDGPPLGKLIRVVLLQGAIFVLLAGLPLFFLPGQTADYFPFNIGPAATAAFLGANYIGVAVVGFVAGLQRSWWQARIAVPASLAFTVLVAALSGLNFSYLDLNRPVTFVWLVVYGLVPLEVLLGVVLQPKAEGVDPAHTIREPHGVFFTAWCALLAVVLIVAGGLLFVATESPRWWPWDLTGQGSAGRMEPYAGAWLWAFAVGFMHLAREKDLVKARPMWPGLLVLAVLQLVVLLRFSAQMGTVPGAALMYATMLMAMIFTALWGWGASSAHASPWRSM